MDEAFCVVLMLVISTWLQFEYVSCDPPLVDCLLKAGHHTDIEEQVSFAFHGQVTVSLE